MRGNKFNNTFIGQIQEFHPYAGGSVRVAIHLDLIDRKIVYLLAENARFSYTYLAKRLRLKRETVAYRIKRMQEHEFLHGHLTLLDHRKLGFKNYMIYLKLRTLNQEKEFLNHLFQIPSVTRLKNCSGTYDVQVIFSVALEEEFVDLFEDIVNKYHSLIQQYDLFEILQEDFLGMNLLLPTEDRKNLVSKEVKGSAYQKEFWYAEKRDAEKEKEQYIFDKKDRQILEQLKLNGDISIKDLSQSITLAPIAIENRIKNMIRTGVIKRFIPLASLNQLGYQWWKVFFKFKSLDKQKFFTFLRYHSNVLWYMRLLGKWDYQFSVFAKDNAEFHQIIDEIRSEFADNILSYDTIIVFNQLKFVQRVE